MTRCAKENPIKITGDTIMEYSILEKDNCVVVEFKGQLTGGPAAQGFRNEISTLAEKGSTNVVGDMGDVSFMNSSGLGTLIATLTSLRSKGGDLKLCNAQDRIKSLLKISKLFTVFDMYETRDEAIEAYSNNK